MIIRELKLRTTVKQDAQLDDWLWNLTGVYNWAIRKIEQDAKDKIYYTKLDFVNLLANHSKILKIPSHTIQGILEQAWFSWHRCFKKIGGKPRLKGLRNKLISIPFPDPIKSPIGNKITFPSFKGMRFHSQVLPDGKIKRGRLVKRASGWYLQLTIDVEHRFNCYGEGVIGIDPGYKLLLSTSEGEIIKHPRELDVNEKRLAQAQRGVNKKLVARKHERIKNQKKDRNHKLSRRLVQENIEIYFSKDNIKGLQKKFGKSVANSNHHQLRQMIAYKSSACGRQFKEVDSRNSTKTCSCCGSLSGPTGLAGLSVRDWTCSACGSHHDRDINAAINTLMTGLGTSPERASHEA